MSQEKWPLNQLLEWLDSCDRKFVTINSIQQSILIALLQFADNKKIECFPALSRLANLSGLNRATIKRNLRILEKSNIVVRVARNDKSGDPDSNLYKIIMHNIFKVGARCAYPGRRAHLPWAQSAPLTKNITNQLTKKPLASPLRYYEKQNHEQKQTAKFWEPGNPDYDRVHGLKKG